MAFTSDLHADHHDEVIDLVVARAREQAADVLVVAGDLSHDLGTLEGSLRRLRAGAPDVAFLAGNHDLWCGSREARASADHGHGPDSRQRYLEAIPELCAAAGVHHLHGGPVVLGGVTLVGQTGWYDYSLRDPAHAGTIPVDAYRRGRFGKLAWSDKHFIHWPGFHDDDGALDDVGLARWMAARLETALDEAPRDQPIVVVTHMLAFDELAPRKPLPWGFVRGFLGSSALGEAILAAAARGAPVVQAIAGHTHFARTATIAVPRSDRVINAETSPVGYPREYGRFGVELTSHVRDRVRVVEVAPPSGEPDGRAAGPEPGTLGDAP